MVYFSPKLWLYVMIWLPRTTDNSTYFAQSLEIRGIESRLYVDHYAYWLYNSSLYVYIFVMVIYLSWIMWCKHTLDLNRKSYLWKLRLISLIPTKRAFTNSADPDQSDSEEAVWSRSSLLVFLAIKLFVNSSSYIIITHAWIPIILTQLMRGVRIQITTISGPSSFCPPAKHHLNGVSLACWWWPKIECWLGSFIIFQGI